METSNLVIEPKTNPDPEGVGDFVNWLEKFDPDLRLRFNGSKMRWGIDERNRETGVWELKFTWETDDGQYLPPNQDLVKRIQFACVNYKKMLSLGVMDYLRVRQREAERLENERIDHGRMDRRNEIIDDITTWRKGWQEAQFGRH